MQRIAKFFACYAAADMSLLTYSRRQSYNKVLKLTNNWKENVRIWGLAKCIFLHLHLF